MRYRVLARKIKTADGVLLEGVAGLSSSMTYEQLRRGVERLFGPERVVWSSPFEAQALNQAGYIEHLTVQEASRG
jgi:hypothetical protein